MSAHDPILVFDDLSLTFRLRDRQVDAVKHLSFSIAKGEVVALVGESGSGKSVSAMSIMRLLQEPPATYPSPSACATAPSTP